MKIFTVDRSDGEQESICKGLGQGLCRLFKLNNHLTLFGKKNLSTNFKNWWGRNLYPFSSVSIEDLESEILVITFCLPIG